MLNRIRTLLTHKIYDLPIVVLMPHSSCNCRCVMCDIWKANHNKKEITAEQLEKHLEAFRGARVREVVLSGGEALLHSNLWTLCEQLRKLKIKITLLSTGLLLERYRDKILAYIDNVIVSVDGSPEVHDAIRNIPNGYAKISSGIRALRELDPSFRITARCVLQKRNYRDFINIVMSAKSIGLDQISFLAADVSSTAFNHTDENTSIKVRDIIMDESEIREFESIIERSFTEHPDFYDSRFIAERPGKMKSIVQYYKALIGLGDYPHVLCNAPWVSTVIESDGSVLPCFFHKPLGNIHDDNLMNILNSPRAISWRKNLNMERDATCRKCVCTLKLGVTQLS